MTSLASTPSGAFRTQPPADGRNEIVVPLGDAVTVNGAAFTDPDPGDELKVEISWGDGSPIETIGCGPCRLSHVYRGGKFTLTATIHDRRLSGRGQVTETWTVIVAGPPEPVAPVATLPPLASGCYDAMGGQLDYQVFGPVNTAFNMRIAPSDNGTCSIVTFNSNTTAVQAGLVGLTTEAEVRAFCLSLGMSGPLTVIQWTVLGFSVPADIWVCAG